MVPRDKQVQKRSSFPLTSLLVPPSKAASVSLKRFPHQAKTLKYFRQYYKTSLVYDEHEIIALMPPR